MRFSARIGKSLLCVWGLLTVALGLLRVAVYATGTGQPDPSTAHIIAVNVSRAVGGKLYVTPLLATAEDWAFYAVAGAFGVLGLLALAIKIGRIEIS
jgi:hypothetical protein